MKRDIQIEAAKIQGTIVELRAAFASAARASGLSSSDFAYEVDRTKNVADGRCPDGCCGNEDAPRWRPTPAEYVAMARRVSAAMIARKAKKAS